MVKLLAASLWYIGMDVFSHYTVWDAYYTTLWCYAHLACWIYNNAALQSNALMCFVGILPSALVFPFHSSTYSHQVRFTGSVVISLPFARKVNKHIHATISIRISTCLHNTWLPENGVPFVIIVKNDNYVVMDFAVYGQYAYRWLSARLPHFHCLCARDTTVLHQTIDITLWHV